MADLPTNYYDDILSASMNGKKKFRLTYRNGTTEEVTIEDISEYDQYGSKFGAGDINKTNQAVNEKFDSDDVVDPMLTTEEGFAADAKLTGDALSELNKNISTINTNISNVSNTANSKMVGEFVLLCTCTPSKKSTFNLNQSVKNFKFILVRSMNTPTTIIPKQEIDEIRNDSNSATGYHTLRGNTGSNFSAAWFKFKTDTTVYFDNSDSVGETRIYGVR